jgi:hypothetical protein
MSIRFVLLPLFVEVLLTFGVMRHDVSPHFDAQAR